MKSLRNLITLVIMVGAWLIVFPSTVHAYVDPGTGSYVLQIIVAGIAAASFGLKIFWTRIKMFLSGKKPAPQPDNDGDAG